MERSGRGFDHSPSSSAEVKVRVELTLTLAAYKQPVIMIAAYLLITNDYNFVNYKQRVIMTWRLINNQ